MENRFNFNAIVTGYYDIDTPDEYSEFEPQIYLENVDIWSGGDIGISRDVLELAIKNQYPNLEKSQFNQIMKFFEDNSNSIDNEAYLTILPYKIIQCTGLKDKNGLNLLFEGDIINTEGIKIGNCYENEYLLKDTTNFVIKGMGTKEWRNSEQEAIKRGCYYAE